MERNVQMQVFATKLGNVHSTMDKTPLFVSSVAESKLDRVKAG